MLNPQASSNCVCVTWRNLYCSHSMMPRGTSWMMTGKCCASMQTFWQPKIMWISVKVSASLAGATCGKNIKYGGGGAKQHLNILHDDQLHWSLPVHASFNDAREVNAKAVFSHQAWSNQVQAFVSFWWNRVTGGVWNKNWLSSFEWESTEHLPFLFVCFLKWLLFCVHSPVGLGKLAHFFTCTCTSSKIGEVNVREGGSRKENWCKSYR